MSTDQVISAFGILLHNLAKRFDTLNAQGALLIKKGKLDEAVRLVESAKRVQAIRQQVKILRNQWPKHLTITSTSPPAFGDSNAGPVHFEKMAVYPVIVKGSMVTTKTFGNLRSYEKAYEREASRYGLLREWLRKKIMVNRTEFQILGLDIARYVVPVLLRNIKTRHLFVASPSWVRHHFYDPRITHVEASSSRSVRVKRPS